MIPLRVQTLIMSKAPAPSVVVLIPEEETRQKNSRIVPIWIGATEAAHMGMALENARCSRPMTHDLFLDALTNLDARIDHMVINDVKGPHYFAKLVLRQGGRLIEIDARPSDAISLTVRQGAPLFIDEEALEKGSFPFVFKEEVDEKEEIENFRLFLDGIAPEDFEA